MAALDMAGCSARSAAGAAASLRATRVLASKPHLARFLLLCSTAISEALNGIHQTKYCTRSAGKYRREYKADRPSLAHSLTPHMGWKRINHSNPIMQSVRAPYPSLPTRSSIRVGLSAVSESA